MAFPFFGKKLPPPPKPPRLKSTKLKKKAARVRKAKPAERKGDMVLAITHLKSLKAGLSSMNQNILSAHKKHDDLKDDLEILKRKFEHLRKNTDLAPHAEKLENVNDDVSLAHEKLLEFENKSKKIELNLTDVGKKIRLEITKLQKKGAEELWLMRSMINDVHNSIAKLKNTGEKDIADLKKSHSEVHAELVDTASELHSKIDSIKVADKAQDTKLSKTEQALAELKKADSSLKGLCDILHSDLASLQGEAKEVMSTFRPATLKKLSSSLGAVSSAVKNMQAEQEETLKDFGKVTKSLASIDRRALGIETESQKTQEMADDLSKMTQAMKAEITEARNEIIDMKNRFNITLNSSSEMEASHEELKQRLMELERKMNSMVDLRSSVNQLNNTASEMQSKLNTIEKTAVKTFVIE